MTTDHAIHTSDYLLSTQSVLYAGRRLQNVLDAERATIEYAVTRLERAAQQHETGGAGYRAFMFSELETTPEAEKATREWLTEDMLASVLTDLQVANVLMAAGQTIGETGEKAEPHLLDEAILRLENTTRTMDRSLASPLAEGGVPRRFGFAEEVTAPEAVQSPDLPAAIKTFRSRSDETLDTLVNDAQGVVTSVLTALDKIDVAKVVAALSNIGHNVPALPRVGRLFRQGVEKLERGIDALINLLGSEMLAQIKDKVEQVWQRVKEGEHVTQVMGWAFRVEDTRAHISEILRSEGLKREQLDDASNALMPLAITFKENMAMAERMAAAVTVGGAVLTLIPLAGPSPALMTAFAYLLILSAVLLIGMDYADSGLPLQRVRGVKEIAQGLVS